LDLPDMPGSFAPLLGQVGFADVDYFPILHADYTFIEKRNATKTELFVNGDLAPSIEIK
jgi:hypothetical protein